MTQSEAVSIDVDTLLRYDGDSCEKMAEELGPALSELDTIADSGMALDKPLRVTGTLTVEVEDGE